MPPAVNNTEKRYREVSIPLYLFRAVPGAYGLLDLLKKRHDPIDDCGEGAAGILSCFDEITTLLGMLHERYKLTGFIFIDQYGSVTATAGS